MKEVKWCIFMALVFLILTVVMIATGHAQYAVSIAGPNMQGHPQTATAQYNAPVIVNGERPAHDFALQTLSEQQRPLGDIAREYRSLPRNKAIKKYEQQGKQ